MRQPEGLFGCLSYYKLDAVRWGAFHQMLQIVSNSASHIIFFSSFSLSPYCCCCYNSSVCVVLKTNIVYYNISPTACVHDRGRPLIFHGTLLLLVRATATVLTRESTLWV